MRLMSGLEIVIVLLQRVLNKLTIQFVAAIYFSQTICDQFIIISERMSALYFRCFTEYEYNFDTLPNSSILIKY